MRRWLWRSEPQPRRPRECEPPRLYWWVYGRRTDHHFGARQGWLLGRHDSRGTGCLLTGRDAFRGQDERSYRHGRAHGRSPRAGDARSTRPRRCRTPGSSCVISLGFGNAEFAANLSDQNPVNRLVSGNRRRHSRRGIVPNLVLALPNEQATVCPQVLEQVVLAHRLPPSCDRLSGMFAEHYHALLRRKRFRRSSLHRKCAGCGRPMRPMTGRAAGAAPCATDPEAHEFEQARSDRLARKRDAHGMHHGAHLLQAHPLAVASDERLAFLDLDPPGGACSVMPVSARTRCSGSLQDSGTSRNVASGSRGAGRS